MPKLEVEPTSDAEPARPAELPRRVLHVLNAAGGGAAMSTIDLIRSLRAMGIDSAAVCHDMGFDAERRRLAEAVDGRILFTPLYWWNRKSRVAPWKRPILEWMQLKATGWRRRSERLVTEFARDYKPDLIHTNTFMTPEGGLAARTLGLPHVWHVRELVGPGAPYRFSGEGAPMRAYLREHASLVVANSQATAERIRDWVPKGMLKTVLNGIDVERFAAVAPFPEATGRPPVVGLVANLTSWKKHDLFFDVAERIASKTSAEFHVYGHFPSDEKLQLLKERLERRGVSQRVRLHGFVADPARIMAEIDVLLHPADHESFGRVLVEAMASGVPIVSVRGGGAAEIVLDGITGLLAPPDDAAGLAACVERLLADATLRKTFGEAGRRRAVDCYSLKRCVEGMAEVYREAMAHPAGVKAATVDS